MAKYLLAYHGGSMPETEAEQAQVMQAWTQWMDELGTAMVDPGNPVSQAMMIAADGAVSAGGGANPVSGYSIVEADSLEAAAKLASSCPVRMGGGSIEVAETFSVM
jgi:hypothetical protein